MTKIQKSGRIITPFGALPNERELRLAKILIRTSKDVKFIPVSLVKTADITYAGCEWEIKSPTGNNARTIERCLRKALKQSSNIILDLAYLNFAENKCITYLQNHIRNFHGIKKLLIITEDERVLKVSVKNSCISEVPVLK